MTALAVIYSAYIGARMLKPAAAASPRRIGVLVHLDVPICTMEIPKARRDLADLPDPARTRQPREAADGLV